MVRESGSGEPEEVVVGPQDLVFVTNGSMTAASSLGTMTSPAPVLGPEAAGGSWALWETRAAKDADFGRPLVFNSHVAESNWLMSVVLAYQPHFLGQPEDVNVFWGYGLFPDQPGNHVGKKMSECSGAEIITELCHHLGFGEYLPLILATSNCIPCRMPFITSQFLPRVKGDRPLVRPTGTTNLAFIGQFCEVPDDVVFTVEYSVRSAQTAVFSLLGLKRPVPPIYKGQQDPGVLLHGMERCFTSGVFQTENRGKYLALRTAPRLSFCLAESRTPDGQQNSRYPSYLG